MNAAAHDFAAWQEHNRRFLAHAVDDLHARMEGEDPSAPRAQLEGLLQQMSHTPTIVQVTESFGLDDFERDLVLLCFAVEVDPRFRIEPDMLTIGYTLEALEHSHWAAVDAAAPLRDWGLIRVEPGPSIADSTLRLADDVTRFLLGFDPRRGGDETFSLVRRGDFFAASQAELAARLAEAIATTLEATGQPPAVELYGADEEDRIAVTQLCANQLESVVATADVRDLPDPGAELDATLKTWARMGRLTSTLLCVTHAESLEEPLLRHRIDRALTRIRGVFFMATRTPSTFEAARVLLRRRVEPLTTDERLAVWEVFAPGTTEDTTRLAADFRLSTRGVERICAEAQAGDATRAPLRAGCSRAVRARLDPLAEHITLDDVAGVVLPATEAEQLLELERSILLAKEVSEDWGLGRGRGGAITALFAGPSGTGKTHAALALASRLDFDLYRVDLAGVLSKYIGETEKNLDRIFDAAEVGGVILLFDEADALFGKRSEVRDSHDRYANLGTSYLLARIETTPTPTILTTNLKEAIDPAFLRRLHFVIDFPFPASAEREEIWRTIYPARTPVGTLEPDRLAAVAATGGTIRNIARRGAFLAAAEREAIAMSHLYEATVRELRTAGRDLTPEELRAWHRSE